MKIRLVTLLMLLFAGVIALAACDSLGLTPTDSESEGGVEKTIYVGPEMVDCVGVAPQQCLLVKENPEDEYTLWYQPIVGFTFEPGYEYELVVNETVDPNPPADASSIQWTLVEQVSKTPVSAETDTTATTDTTETTTTDAAAETTTALEGTLWQMVSYMDSEGATQDAIATPGTEVTAEFTQGEINGAGGCNNYFGSYVVEGDTITIGPIGSTMMLCQPQQVMAQESAYFAALESAATYTVGDNQLVFNNADGQTVLTYMATEPLSLAGQTWIMTFYNNGKGGAVSALAGVNVTADFDEKGNLSGSAGCNNYSSTYETDGDAITIGPALTTRKACAEPDGIMDQESQYLAAIQNAAVYSIRGNDLELRDADGSLMASYRTSNQDVVNALLLAALGNVTYQSEFTASGEAPLQDGVYTEEAAPDSATMTTVMLTDDVAYGELSTGQKGAAVVLVTDPGGSGTFYDLAVVVPQDGQLTNVATTPLGDRVQVNSVDIVDGSIVVDMVQSGPDDPLCCPTQHVINTYALEGDELVLVSSEDVTDAEESAGADQPAEPQLTNTTWLFTQFAGSDDSEINFAPSDLYTLLLNDDGTFTAMADCKGTEGNYTVDGNSLTLELGPSITLYCGDDSYSDQYLLNLSNVVSYVFDDNGGLVLNLMADAGNMSYVAGDSADSSDEEASETIVGVTWQWVDLTTPVETVTVPNPEAYTMTLNEDGTFNYSADCNVGSATYTIDGSNITFDLTGPTTLAFCGEESLDQTFLAALGAAAIYFTQDGDLYIDLMADGGTMHFTAVSAEDDTAAEDEAVVEVVDVVWKWESLTTPVEETVVPTPESYLLLLNPDGTVSIQADCNSGGGNYTIDGSNITIEILFTTQAFCGEESLDTLYIQSLNAAAIYFTQDGNLFIDLFADSGTMRFSSVEGGA